MSAQAYAKAVVYVRSVLRLLLKPEVLREVVEAGSFHEALATLPETIYPGLRDAKSPSDAERAIWAGLLEAYSKAARLSPPHVRPAILLPAALEELKDLLILMDAAQRGAAEAVARRIPTAAVGWSETSKLSREPEALQSPQRLVESISSPALRARASSALQLSQRWRASPLLYYAAGALEAASEAISSVPPRERRLYISVVCPRLRYIVVSGLLQAKDQGVDPRMLGEAFGAKTACGLSWRLLRGSYEREPDPQGLAQSLQHLIPGWRAEGSIPSILEAARRAVRASLWSRASAAIAGYPFQAGFIAGGMELVRLQSEDLMMVLSAVHLGLKPDDYLYRMAVALK